MRETGKTRAQRIQLDYFRRADGIKKLRTYAILFAVIAATCYGAYALSSAGSSHLSTGPLSNAHRAYEKDCSKCHGSGIGNGISQDAWHPWLEDRLSTLEQSCQECHPVSGHFRDGLKDTALDRDCAACHREHLGRAFQPRLVSDESCAKCHADLGSAMIAGSSQLKNSVVAFDLESHGDFRSIAQDKGRILFDHAQHMLPGQVEQGQRGGFVYGAFEANWRQLYQKRGDEQATDPVQLSCQDCHQPYGQESVAEQSAHGKEHGVGFNPIRFDRHCSACHTLNFKGRQDQQLPLPHAAPWQEIHALLKAKVFANRLEERIPSTKELVVNQEELNSQGQANNNLHDSVPSDKELSAAIEMVRQRCLKCHSEADITPEAIRTKEESEYLPSAWLRHGHFDHGSHAKMDCQYCHPGTLHRIEPPDAMDLATKAAEHFYPPTDHQTVMIRGIASCTTCHYSEDDIRSNSTEFSTTPSQARGPTSDAQFPEELLGTQPHRSSADCSSCHRYHWTRASTSGLTDSGARVQHGHHGATQ